MSRDLSVAMAQDLAASVLTGEFRWTSLSFRWVLAYGFYPWLQKNPLTRS